MTGLKAVLEEIYAARSPRHLANDPLSFCHRYTEPADREVAAVIAAAFAYGGIKVILRNLGAVFAELGPSPRRYVETFAPRAALKTFGGFRHRFNDGRDLVALLWAIRLMVQDAGSVNAFFLQRHRTGDDDVSGGLNGYAAAVRELDYSPISGSRQLPADSGFHFLFPAPADGSACKRLCMFLRWVVRPSDGIDLGLWHGVSPAQLIIPVDTHISRIGTYLGLTRRKNADWRMACEITAALRRLDPHDPVKFDFPLAHLGISEGCGDVDHLSCLTCDIRQICPQSGIKAR